MTLIKSGILFASAASLMVLAACNSHDSTVPAKDGVAATVNGIPINESLVGWMLKERVGMGRDASAEARARYIDRLTMQVLVAEAAVKKGLDKQPEVANRLELGRLSVLTDAFREDYLKNNPISDEALKAEYEKLSAQEAGTEYKVRHILLGSEADAKAIIAKLKANPKAFESLANEKSKDEGSRGRGGDLGWMDPRNAIPEFRTALGQMAKGKYSEEPVKTQFGYHVMLVEDSRPKSVPPLEQVKAQLAARMTQQSLENQYADLKAKAKIVVAQTPAAAPTEKDAAKKESASPEPAKK